MNEEPRTKNAARPRWIDPAPLTALDAVNFLVGLCVVCAVSTLMMVAITIKASREARRLAVSERQAWEQVHTLRATVAALWSEDGPGEGIATF